MRNWLAPAWPRASHSMTDRILPAVRRVFCSALLCLLAACSDQDPEATDTAADVEVAQAEAHIAPDTGSLVTHTEIPASENESQDYYETDDISELDLVEEDEIEASNDFEVIEDDDPLEAIYEELRNLEPITDDEVTLALQSTDPMTRARGAWNLEPEGEQLDQLLQIAAHDPDPVVRIAALASLEEGENFASMKALIDALQDPDPEVVVAAIDSLEYAGDASNVRDLEPLLWHYDERVTRAAANAIEFLGN